MALNFGTLNFGDWYVLRNRVPVPCSDPLESLKEKAAAGDSWTVALTPIPGVGEVSTVFLGFDQNHGKGLLQLFETMVFLDNGDGVVKERYATWAEAELGHVSTVKQVLQESQSTLSVQQEVRFRLASRL